ncbi:MAG TPA: hypothetical protein VF541_04710 [Longimicrobium sp.]|jgi:hypothetical protein
MPPVTTAAQPAAGRPAGFALLAFCLARYVFGAAVDLMDPAWRGGGPWPAALLRLAVVVVSAVACEALWMVRPWAARAVGALAALIFLGVAVRTGTGVYSGALVWLALLAGLMGVVVWYVHGHVQARYGPTVILQRRRRVPWRP